jgi:hypothetical protein
MSEQGRFFAAVDGERIVKPIQVRRDTMRALSMEAAFRKMTVERLIERLLDNASRGDLAAVLDR